MKKKKTVLVPKEKCKNCKYHFYSNFDGIVCQYVLTKPKDAKAKTRTVNPDGTRQTPDGECDKFCEGKSIKEVCMTSLFKNK